MPEFEPRPSRVPKISRQTRYYNGDLLSLPGTNRLRLTGHAAKSKMSSFSVCFYQVEAYFF